MGKWIEPTDRPQKGNSRATLLIWMWEKLCRMVDFLTLDLMTGKSWVKKAGSRCALPEASPQEAERPALPPAVIVHLSLSDRLDKRETASPPELEALKRGLRKMRDRELVEKLVREVGGC